MEFYTNVSQLFIHVVKEYSFTSGIINTDHVSVSSEIINVTFETKVSSSQMKYC